MPVQKFRSIEDMDRAPVLARGGDFERFLRQCARYWTIAPRIYPRGVFKFRTLEEAQHARARHRVVAVARRGRNAESDFSG